MTSIPGILNIQIGKAIKASGAIGIFVLVFDFYPIGDRPLVTNPKFECKASDNVRMTLFLNNSEQVTVKAGDTLKVQEISGQINFGPIVGLLEPSGETRGLFGFDLSRYSVASELPHGAVLYKFTNQKWNILEPNSTIIFPADGSINLEVNDKEKSNNYGYFVVKLEIK